MRTCLSLSLLLVALLAACAGAADRRTVPNQTGRLFISERDYRIIAPARVRAGRVRVEVTNHGPDEHGLIIVRWRRGGLPVRPDGITINVEALHPLVELGGAPPGARRWAFVRLRAGRYIIFCNMAGHYMAGMHATFEVR
jgi:hypothetical protein